MNYDKLLVTANKLISKNGRPVILYAQGRTPAADVNKPWKGVQENVDPNTVSIKLETTGVFVPPNTVRQFGITSLGEGTEFKDMLSKSEEIIIIPGAEVNFRQFNFVRERGTDYGILASQVLRPGTLTLLAFVGIRR